MSDCVEFNIPLDSTHNRLLHPNNTQKHKKTNPMTNKLVLVNEIYTKKLSLNQPTGPSSPVRTAPNQMAVNIIEYSCDTQYSKE